MFDQSFTTKNISRQLRKSDFIRSAELRNDIVKASTITEAVNFSETCHFVREDFNSKQIKGNPVYVLNDLPKELVLRKANSNLKRLYRLKQTDRDAIVNQLKSLLKEQLPYHLYRLDIHKFYESIQHNVVLDLIHTNTALNYRTKNFITNFLKAFNSEESKGFPRGISLSATLSELLMRKFDHDVQQHLEVFYYARFVDDIVIVTSTKESKDFVTELENILPGGLRFNSGKDGSEKISIVKATPSHTKAQKFTYLGYEFLIDEQKKSTKDDKVIKLDIAQSKTKRIKTRLIKSFINFEKNNDFKLLLDRVKLLTSNYSLLDKKKEIQVMSGIYYNYKCIDDNKSKSLRDLDSLLRRIIYNNKSLSSSGSLNLSTRQRNELLKYSFSNGFKKRIKVHFSPTRQNKLQRTWKDDR
ncbi:TPA: antiviral reverse transcriptase Drt3a [Vibrio parahaemolyticus]